MSPQAALRARGLAGLALAACAAGIAPPSLAGGVVISPVRVDISSPRRAVAVTFTNGGTEPITLQSLTRAWSQAEGRDVYAPTDDLLVVPATAKVPPGASQVFRVALRRPLPAPAERSYRLVLEDISAEQGPANAATLRFRINHDLPVFVAGAKPAVPDVRWSPCPADTGTGPAADPAPTLTCLRLTNHASSRIRVSKLTLQAPGWQEEVPLPAPLTVLAGATRTWQAALASAPAAGIGQVTVHTPDGQTLPARAQ